MGGMSTERKISLKTGRAVSAALRERGWDVTDIDVGPDLPARLAEAKIDVAWNALHGAFGEDGCVQGLLEILRVPYTGSSARSSAIAMDKIATKRMLRGTDVRLIADRTWRPGEEIPSDLSFPVVSKTPNGGSTIGVFICPDPGSLEAALVRCGEFEPAVLIEQAVIGEEITVAVLDGRPLPVVSIRPLEADHFDFEAKYEKGKTEYLVPAPLPEAVVSSAQAQAVAAYQTLGLSGVARADFIVDAEQRPWFLEVNTLPGMTATSLVPMAAGASGISFGELVEHLLRGARLHLTPAE